MKTILSSLTILLLLSVMQVAQWRWQNPTPQGNSLYDIQFIDSMNGWAVGIWGTIMKTTDGGNTWNVLQAPVKDLLLKVWFVNPEKGWCSSYSKVTYTSNNGGLSWETVSALNGRYIYSMQFLNEKVGFVGTNYPSGLLKTTDGGQSWNEMGREVLPYYVGNFFFLNENYGWVNFGSNQIGTTTDGGRTWNNSYVPGFETRIAQIQFIDTKTGFLVGNSCGFMDDYNNYGIFAFTADGGLTWTSRQIPDIHANLSQVHFVNKNTGYISENSYPNSRIFFTTNQGVSWKVYTTAGSKFTFADSLKAWAIDGLNIVHSTADGWKTSVQQTPSATPVILWSVSAFDSLNAAACGQYENVIVTNDGGRTWTRTHSSGNSQSPIELNSIFYKNIEEIWVAGIKGRVLFSKDKGKSWQKFNLDTLSWLADVTFIDDSTGFIIGSYANNGYLFRTGDFGKSWQKTHSFQQSLDRIKFTRTGIGWISGYDYILRSTDRGNSWQKIETPGTYYKTLDAFDNYIWIPRGNSLLVSTDAGSSWNTYKVFDYKESIFSVSAISFTDKNNGLIGLDGRIVRTTDGGKSWKEDEQISSNDIFSISSADKNHAWAVGAGGMILNYNKKTTDAIVAKGHPLNIYSLRQNYPNPFNPNTTISYSIPKESNVEIKVFDILGREVSTLVSKEQSAGKYTVQFDGSSLPSGIYVYSIHAGEYRASRKLMLLK